MWYVGFMKELDGRKLGRKTLEEIRIRAVKRVEAGESPEVVIKALGLSRPRIYQWIAKYREGGIDALRSRSAPGRPPSLSGAQLQMIYRIVTKDDPRQLKFSFALWTCALVREMIREKFDIHLSEVSVGRVLKKLGLTPQRPLWRAYQQDNRLVVSWMAIEYPKIQALAKAAGAAIFWGDESAIRSDYHSGTTWAIKGKTPVVAATGARFKVNMLSAISARGTLHFMVTDKNVNSTTFIEFLEGLLHDSHQPVYLIVDNHPVHKSAQVQAYVASTGGRLRIFYLPPYSPELNPDEQVWNHVKHHGIGRMLIKGLADLKERVMARLKLLQSTPEIVRNFFRHRGVLYCSMFANL
jgi:transposase